jgi:cytochrome c oxidase subunit 4
MNDPAPTSSHPREAQQSLWFGPSLAWLGLIALLATSILVAKAPLGIFKLPLNLGLVTIQALVMGLVFMRLNRASALIRLAAGASFLWIALLFILTLAAVLT